MATYKVVRHFQSGTRRTLKRGLTLEQAQAWCQDSETSSRTCVTRTARARTRRNGPWFDGYTEEK